MDSGEPSSNRPHGEELEATAVAKDLSKGIARHLLGEQNITRYQPPNGMRKQCFLNAGRFQVALSYTNDPLGELVEASLFDRDTKKALKVIINSQAKYTVSANLYEEIPVEHATSSVEAAFGKRGVRTKPSSEPIFPPEKSQTVSDQDQVNKLRLLSSLLQEGRADGEATARARTFIGEKKASGSDSYPLPRVSDVKLREVNTAIYNGLGIFLTNISKGLVPDS
ncbi:MAG: hypothetical protein AAB553_08010 [Patescibacteria group bacterium]